MQNGDFELDGYLIGAGQPVIVTNFQTGGMEERGGDVPHPQANRRIFGRDFMTPPIWSFEFHVAQPTGAAADTGVLTAMERLATAWMDSVDPTIPGAVTALRYMIGGRTRIVYGRPRNFVPDPSTNIADGSMKATAQFALRDPYTYSDALETVDLGLRQPPTGYATLPAVWPLQTVVESTRAGAITVGSTVRATTPQDITFYGPVTNPSLKLEGGWTVSLLGTIPYDGWVRVDFLDGTVRNQSGAAVGGLSRKTYLPDIVLPPGLQGLLFTGQDATGTAHAVIRWRSAFHSI